ncbi:hypothetical protein [Roseivirga misakiensis]|uniref:Lipocalin-like domain-containing protein n=1 Tax=Roseivirga misakiensis TaxID=1563681 RepID=A0A1E5SY26_9BACT|nr:hypothetical protein [Roseivirga misakiensis]OEK04028.1 hypothetical protein BFP71_11060 [Roseivirga misakiensis]
MKIAKRYLLLLFISCLYLSCGNDDAPPNAQELAFERLAGTWDLANGGSIIIDGEDASLNYPNFGLSFTDGGYNTMNAGELFSASGTWEWANEEAGEITLDRLRTIIINDLTETNFQFSFTFTGSGGEANLIDGISGNYVITVKK